jgi:hypothetical protein
MYFLQSFGLLHVHPPPIPSVMLSLRRRSKEVLFLLILTENYI